MKISLQTTSESLNDLDNIMSDLNAFKKTLVPSSALAVLRTLKPDLQLFFKSLNPR